MNNTVILCVEDNAQIQLFNKPLLEAKGFTVRPAMTLAGAREILGRETPGLIILDIHLPDGNGLDFLRELRKTSNVPVIALTNNRAEQDLVTGLASGCDDYITKPYTFPVLYARIEAVLRRVANMPDVIEKSGLRLNVLAGQAFLDGADLLLKPKEFLLLSFLLQHENTLISAEKLYETVWKAPDAGDRRTLQNHISAIRKKLEGGGCAYTIRSVYGKGYCFEKI
jgi:DNA-binding response OmpR family regulator